MTSVMLILLTAAITAGTLIAVFFFYLLPELEAKHKAEIEHRERELTRRAEELLTTERNKLQNDLRQQLESKYEAKLKETLQDFRRANEQVYSQALAEQQSASERNLTSLRQHYEAKLAQMESLHRQILEEERKKFESKLEELRAECDKRVNQARKESAASSRSIVRGIISEQLAPFLPGFEFFPGDCRFLGQPVDYIVFSGMCNERDTAIGGEGNGQEDGKETDLEIVFIDVKTGNAQLSRIQRLIRNAVQAGRVSFETFQIRDDMIVRKSVGYRTFVKEIELTNGSEDG